MMTTDRYAKAARSELPGGASLAALKGAGMIEPNMGTMLCFLVTDAAMERSTMQACLERCVKGTLGSVGVDGDESTSAKVVLLSSDIRTKFSSMLHYALGDVLAQLGPSHRAKRRGHESCIEGLCATDLDEDLSQEESGTGPRERPLDSESPATTRTLAIRQS